MLMLFCYSNIKQIKIKDLLCKNIFTWIIIFNF